MSDRILWEWERYEYETECRHVVAYYEVWFTIGTISVPDLSFSDLIVIILEDELINWDICMSRHIEEDYLINVFYTGICLCHWKKSGGCCMVTLCFWYSIWVFLSINDTLPNSLIKISIFLLMAASGTLHLFIHSIILSRDSDTNSGWLNKSGWISSMPSIHCSGVIKFTWLKSFRKGRSFGM